MKYQVEIEGQTHEVDVQFSGETALVRLNGKSLDADVRRIPGGVNLIIDGVVHDVLIGGKPARLDVAAGGTRLRASAISERMAGRRKKGGSGGGAGELRAPMPGRIVSVAVSVGQEVNVGDSLVVIEAMKMQNELRAEVAGKVVEVAVSAEQSVEADALLVVVK